MRSFPWRHTLLTICALVMSAAPAQAQPALDLSGRVAVHIAPPLAIVGEISRFGSSFNYFEGAKAHGYGFMAGPLSDAQFSHWLVGFGPGIRF